MYPKKILKLMKKKIIAFAIYKFIKIETNFNELFKNYIANNDNKIMTDFIKNYNFNIMYICLLLLLYNIWNTNYELINILLNKIYLFNYTSLFIIINLVGLYLLLKKISFEFTIKLSYNF